MFSPLLNDRHSFMYNVPCLEIHCFYAFDFSDLVFGFVAVKVILEMKVSSFSNGLRIGISYTFNIEYNTAINPHTCSGLCLDGNDFFSDYKQTHC